MLAVIKDMFFSSKDYAGRSIDAVIHRLSANTHTRPEEWSYIEEACVYENTVTMLRIYPHELKKYAA